MPKITIASTKNIKYKTARLKSPLLVFAKFIGGI